VIGVAAEVMALGALFETLLPQNLPGERDELYEFDLLSHDVSPYSGARE
jgi:hypothetical protein